MRAFKFLDRDGCAVYSGLRWPLPEGDTPGGWIDAPEVHPCRAGIHACAPADLAYWLEDSLWEIELAGEVVTSRHKVVAPRGRLVRQIPEYHAAVKELGVVGAWRARDRAIDALRATGFDELAQDFEACTSVAALAAFGPAIGNIVDESTVVGTAAALAADAGNFAQRGEPAQAPFVAACAAGHAAAGASGARTDFDTGYADERHHQSAWLTERLGLA